jgi:hypothetical protein
MNPMSTTKARSGHLAQRPLDDYSDASCRLPIPWQEPALSCELCDDTTGIIIASDIATLCYDCSARLAKLPLDQIPATLHVLRLARRRVAEMRAQSAARSVTD